MRYEVIQDQNHPDTYRVEAWNMAGDGELIGAMFYGANARERAEAYAALMNGAVLAHA